MLVYINWYHWQNAIFFRGTLLQLENTSIVKNDPKTLMETISFLRQRILNIAKTSIASRRAKAWLDRVYFNGSYRNRFYVLCVSFIVLSYFEWHLWLKVKIHLAYCKWNLMKIRCKRKNGNLCMNCACNFKYMMDCSVHMN